MATKGKPNPTPAAKSVPAKPIAAPAPVAKPAFAAAPVAKPIAAPAPAKTAAKTVDQAERQRMIAEAAYYIAEKRGFSAGNHDADWAEAERQIDELLKKRK